MNIAIINKKTGKCENITVFRNTETARAMFNDYDVTEQIEGFGIGDIFKYGKWEKSTVTAEPEVPQPIIEEQLTELQLAVAEIYEKII